MQTGLGYGGQVGRALVLRLMGYSAAGSIPTSGRVFALPVGLRELATGVGKWCVNNVS